MRQRTYRPNTLSVHGGKDVGERRGGQMNDAYFMPGWRWITAWVERMNTKYPGWSYPSENAIEFGQGICREMYGKNWAKDIRWKRENNKDSELEDIDPNVIDRARRWEDGEIPGWCSE